MGYDDLFDDGVMLRLQAMVRALRKRKVPGVYAQEGPRGFRIGESEDILRRAAEERAQRRAQLGPRYTTTPLVVEPNEARRRLYERALIQALRNADPKGSKNPVDH
jgi:hypothetical protein